MNSPDAIKITVWWGKGTGRMIRRDALPGDHPEHIYNYMIREMGVEPEEYGIERPIGSTIECPRCGLNF